VPRVFLSEAAFDDLLRLEEFLAQSEDPMGGELLDFILDALHVLTHQPGIGRPVEGGLRELIISRRRSGYSGALRIRPRERSGFGGAHSPSAGVGVLGGRDLTKGS